MTHGNAWLDAREAHAVIARAGLDALGSGEVLCASTENYAVWFPETAVVVQVHGIRGTTVAALRGPFGRRGFTRGSANGTIPPNAGQGSTGTGVPVPPHPFPKGASAPVVAMPPEAPPMEPQGGQLIPRYLFPFPVLHPANGAGASGSNHGEGEGAASPHYIRLDEAKQNDSA